MYALIVLFMDIYFGVAPEHAAATLQACGCCKSIAQRANAHDVAKTGKGSKRGTEMLHDDADDDLEMASNPLMMQAMTRAGTSAGGIESNVSIERLLEMEAPPGKESWAGVRLWMRSLHGSVEQLKARLHDQQVEQAKSSQLDADAATAGSGKGKGKGAAASRQRADPNKSRRRFGQQAPRSGALSLGHTGGATNVSSAASTGSKGGKRSMKSLLRRGRGAKAASLAAAASPIAGSSEGDTAEESMMYNPLQHPVAAASQHKSEAKSTAESVPESKVEAPASASVSSMDATDGTNPMARRVTGGN